MIEVYGNYSEDGNYYWNLIEKDGYFIKDFIGYFINDLFEFFKSYCEYFGYIECNYKICNGYVDNVKIYCCLYVLIFENNGNYY